MFDDDLLEHYAERFLGHGSPAAHIWFVGMEEGGGGTFHELDQRFRNWDKRRLAFTYICPRNPEDKQKSEWFRARPKLQRTWSGLIRIQFGIKGDLGTLDVIKQYQRDSLCRTGKECLIELLPLPSPSTDPKKWLYNKHSRLPWLSSRSAYQKHLLQRRSEKISGLIRKHKPRAVVFYGLRYWDWWVMTARAEFKKTRIKRVFVARSSNTLFSIVPHPVARGLRSDCFLKVGKLLAQLLP
jgi:hypothetical protein